MRNLFLAITLAFTAGIYAQELSAAAKKETKNPEYKCNVLTMDRETKVIEMSEGASFKSEDITIENADKIVYNTLTKELTVTGKFTYSFSGDVNISAPLIKNELHYKISDTVAYLN